MNKIIKKATRSLKQIPTLTNIANATFILGVSVLCFQQCYIQISEYLDYKTRIQVTHSIQGSTIWLLPGITICNNNRLRIERLIEEYPELNQRVRRIIEGDGLILSDSRRIDWLKSMKEALDATVNVTDLINESTLKKLMHLSRATMINDVNCSSLWGRQLNCENFQIVESYQSAACYTLFYLGSLYEALANGKAYDFTTSLLGGKRKIDSFDNYEIADILVDFEPLQQADYERSSGGKFIIHSTGHIGLLKDLAHPIQAGQKYEIMLQRTMTKRLPPPYDSNCFDNKYQNAESFYRGEVYPRTVLDRTGCLRNCILEHSISKCKCWPVEVPYYPDDPLINASGSYKLCPWADEKSHNEQSAMLYIECYKKFTPTCQKRCRPSCRTEDYKVKVVSSSWPARDSFLAAGSDMERRELHRLKSRCAKISIKYLQFQEQRNIMYPNLTLVQLVSNLGGIVSALVGVSAITVYRFITRKVCKCRIVNDHEYLHKPRDARLLLSK